MAPLLRAAVLLGVCASVSCYPLRPCSEEKLFTEDGQLNHAKPRDETFANSIRAYVIGDFGVDSKENALQEYRSDFDVEKRDKVAQWMEWYSSPAATVSKSHLGQRKAAADFVINVGDSFYTDGIRNTTDSRWNTTYEHVFTEPQNAYWYSVLGNHDWYGNEIRQDDRGTTAQVNYTQDNPYNKWCMPDFNYTMTATVTGDQPFTAQFVFIDTMTMLLDVEGGCRNASDDHTVSRRRTACRGDVIPLFADQYKWIEETLCSSTADWKIVVGHHPLVSAGYRMRAHDKTVTNEWVEELYTKGLITESVRDRMFKKYVYDPEYLNTTMDATLTEMLSRCGTDAYLGGHEHMTQLLTHTHRETGHKMTLFSYGDSGKANLENTLTVDPDATACRITGQCFADDVTVKAAWGDEWSLDFKDFRGGFGDLEIFYDRMVLDTVSADGLRLHQLQQKKCRTNCAAESPTAAPNTTAPTAAPTPAPHSCDDGLSSAEIAAVAVCAVLGVAIFAAAAFFAGRAAGAKPSNEPM